MKVIGLTGGIASGKSTVSSVLKSLGATIIDVDIIARKVVTKGEEAYNNIIKHFGTEILLPTEEINRKKLGSIVFSDAEKLKTLNTITHPEIIRLLRINLEELKAKNVEVVVVDAAILIEMGLHELVDEIWLVIVNKETQIKRLMERDRFAYAEAINRINSQFTNEQRMEFADVIIDNNKPLEDVSKYIEYLWNNVGHQ